MGRRQRGTVWQEDGEQSPNRLQQRYAQGRQGAPPRTTTG
jgi:hypothetical protein